jgi:L-ascorbate metabolism protein UlaG (beta-lactamase superfamily)
LERGRRITWLGQAGFRIEVEETVFVVDPWISEHEDRITPSAPLELAADDVDVLLVTHEHLDHLDLPFLPSLLERSPDARVVLPAAIASHVEGIVSESRLVLVEPGYAVDLNGVELRVTPAFHGVSLDDAYGDGSAVDGRPRFVGYMLGSERRIYHAGDSIVTDELIEALETLGIDVALLPINGRDAEREARGIIGNMDAGEAVELALRIGASTLVPYHWDAVAGNTVAPGTVVDAADGRLHVLVPARFRPLVLDAA